MGKIGSTDTLSNILQLLGVLLVFILILASAVFVTRWLGTTGIVQPKTRNVSLLESFRIGPNKYIQILSIGTKYYAVGVTKDQITNLTELDEEQLDLKTPEMKEPVHFKDVIKKVIKKG